MVIALFLLHTLISAAIASLAVKGLFRYLPHSSSALVLRSVNSTVVISALILATVVMCLDSAVKLVDAAPGLSWLNWSWARTLSSQLPDGAPAVSITVGAVFLLVPTIAITMYSAFFFFLTTAAAVRRLRRGHDGTAVRPIAITCVAMMALGIPVAVAASYGVGVVMVGRVVRREICPALVPAHHPDNIQQSVLTEPEGFKPWVAVVEWGDLTSNIKLGVARTAAVHTFAVVAMFAIIMFRAALRVS